MAFGLAVQNQWQDLGISQGEAAALIGLHRTHYADVERRTRNMGLKNVVTIARGLGVVVSDLGRKVK